MSIGAWSFWLMFRPLQVVDSSLIFSIDCNLFNIYKTLRSFFPHQPCHQLSYFLIFISFLIFSPAMSWAFERGWSGWIGRDWWALCHPARPFSFYPSLKIQNFHNFPFSYCTNPWKYWFVKFSYFHIVLIPKVWFFLLHIFPHFGKQKDNEKSTTPLSTTNWPWKVLFMVTRLCSGGGWEARPPSFPIF